MLQYNTSIILLIGQADDAAVQIFVPWDNSGIPLKRSGFTILTLIILGMNAWIGTVFAASGPLTYVTKIEGAITVDLRRLLEESSQARQFQDRSIVSLPLLRRRIEGDRARLDKALRSQGFYDGKIDGRVDPSDTPMEVILTVKTGPVYLIEDYVIRQSEDQVVPIDLPALEEIGIEVGSPAEASRLKSAEDALVKVMHQSGYPAAKISNIRYVVDHDRTTVTTHVLIAPGPPAFFGPLTIIGLETIHEQYVRVIADWRVGQRYSSEILTDLRYKMNRSSLFTAVTVEVPPAPDENGRLPVTLRLRERVQRTVAVGFRITSSDELFSGNASWQHRNFLGGGETLKAETTLSSLQQEAALGFRKPVFLVRDQTFVSSTVMRHEDSDAFEESSLSARVGLERQTAGIYTTGIGIASELASLSDSEEEAFFALIGAPVSFARDTRDSPLDATTGTRFSATVTPWASLSESSSGFVVGEMTGAVYQSLGTPRVVVAARARLGSILAGELRDIPANKRFYAGGGASIRGYEFRRVGPLDSGGDPTGGRSVAEIGAELRLLVTEDIGVVPFVDGGQTYKTTVPSFDGQFRWAAGLGLRYITPIGPIRLDVAFPLDRRAGIDDRFQFYISIGQAF